MDEEVVAEEPAPPVPDKSGRSGPDAVGRAVAGVRSATAVLAAPVASAASAARRRYRRAWWLPGWLFAAITLLPALVAMAWLLPGIVMLLVERLLPLPMLIIFVPLALALCYFTMRQLPVGWPRFAAPRADSPGTERAETERGAAEAGAGQGDSAGAFAEPPELAESALADPALADPALADPPLADPALADSSLAEPSVAEPGLADVEPADGGLPGAELADAALPDVAVLPQPMTDGRRRPAVPAQALLLTVAIAVGFAVWQVVYRSQQIIVVGDPGTYLQYGYWIAQHGTARIPQSATAFGSAGGLNFASLGFYQSGSVVTPAFMPGLPLVLAAGVWTGGVQGALLMPTVIGGCAVLSFAGLVGRLAGPRWAPAGALILALTLPEQFVSRAPYSEPLVQVLLFGGLCMVVDSLVVTRPRGGHAAAMTLAGFGGLALGLTVLVSIGSLSTLLPVFPILALMFVSRRPQAGPLGIGLLLGVACGLYAGLALARPYLSALSAQLHLFGLSAAGFGVLTALIAPLAFPGTRAWLRRVLLARTRVVGLRGESTALPSLGECLQWLAFALPFALLIGFAVRPYLQVTRGQTDPAVIRYVAGLQRLEHLPVDGRRQYYESSLNWVLWYLGVPALLLAVAGAAVLGRRMVRAGLAWGDSLLAARMWGLTYLIIAWSAVTVLWDPAVVAAQPGASRRLVPVVLPGLILLGLWASTRLKARAAELGARRATAAIAATCCVLAMAIPAFVTSVNPGLAPRPSVSAQSSGLSKLISRLRFRGVAVSTTYGGSLAAVSRLCAAIGPSASVVFVDAVTAQELSQVVRSMCGQPAASVAGASTSTIEQVVTFIEQAGRRPVLLGAARSRLTLFGIVPREVLSLHTSSDPAVLTGPPATTWPVTYTVWISSPLGPKATTSGL